MTPSAPAQSRVADLRRRLSSQDWALLRRFEDVVDGLAMVLGSSCEIVLHALEDPSRSVIKICNGHLTGRTVGSPMTDFGLEIMQNPDRFESGVAGVYHTTSARGTPMKSVTVLIRNQRGRLVGLMCVNVDLAIPLVEFARDLLQPALSTTPSTVEHFPVSTTDLVSSALEEALREADQEVRRSARERNRLVVAQLFKRGVFGVKGAVDIVARRMRISRYTVYNYVREARVDATLGQ